MTDGHRAAHGDAPQRPGLPQARLREGETQIRLQRLINESVKVGSLNCRHHRVRSAVWSVTTDGWSGSSPVRPPRSAGAGRLGRVKIRADRAPGDEHHYKTGEHLCFHQYLIHSGGRRWGQGATPSRRDRNRR